MTRTAREVRTFQAEHFDWQGQKLVVDGDVGPRTAWSLAVSEQDIARRASIRRASSVVGLRESPSNRGKLIDGWNQRCGVELGSPWCAAYVSWAISVLGAEDVCIAGAMRLGYRFPLVPFGVPARAGDLFFFDTDGPLGEKGHIGELVSDEENGEFAVNEGNSRNMVRVVRRLRSDGLLSRWWQNQTGPHVPLPRNADGSHCLDLVRAHLIGTR